MTKPTATDPRPILSLAACLRHAGHALALAQVPGQTPERAAGFLRDTLADLAPSLRRATGAGRVRRLRRDDPPAVSVGLIRFRPE